MFNTSNNKNTGKFNKLININSLFREIEYVNSCNSTPTESLDYTDSKYNSSNFPIWLPSPLENVLSMTLKALELPHTFYTISSELKTNVFTIINNDTNTRHVIEILNGNYTTSEIIKQLNYSILNISELNGKIEFSFDTSTGKCYVYNLDPSSPLNFDLDFSLPNNESREIFKNLGWILGFRKSYYSYSKDYLFNDSADNINLSETQRNNNLVNSNYDNSKLFFNFNTDPFQRSPLPIFPNGYVSEGIIDISGPKYLFLMATDFTKGQKDNYTSLTSKNTHIPASDILARINIPTIRNQIGFTNLSDFIPRKREYFGPVKIEKIHFKIIDEFGRNINLNNNDISLLLDFEIAYNNNNY